MYLRIIIIIIEIHDYCDDVKKDINLLWKIKYYVVKLLLLLLELDN